MSNADQDTNTYAGIAEHYDGLMTSGYYDYDAYADALHDILGPRTRVMELGVGTGLLAAKLLERGDYELLGIDNTPAMLEQARERYGDKIETALQDVTELDLDRHFQAAFSVGGAWYFVKNDDGTLEMCSHIADRAAAEKGLKRVVDHLEPGGVLAFALQGPHTNYARPIDDELTYEQEIDSKDNGLFIKRYVIRRGDDVVGEQYYSYLMIPLPEADAMLTKLGLVTVGLDPSGEFYIYVKMGA